MGNLAMKALILAVLALSFGATVALEVHEAGPGQEEEGSKQMEIDEAYQEHVGDLLNSISMIQGKADVKYTDLNPQMVDVHTIAPRIPALRVGMNALGHNMLHVHSDEDSKWSAEILSSGLSAGFSFTDRVKGLQKTDGKPGTQWTMYSAGKILRIKDNAQGELIQLKDGLMVLKGNKGDGATKPRLTIQGGKNSVPRLTLVSKSGEDPKHISLYNRFGKFGVFSGVMDKSIMHLTADGSELALTTGSVQPHVTIESTAKDTSTQEVVFKGGDQSLKMYHKTPGCGKGSKDCGKSHLGFCGVPKGGKKCQSFFQAQSDGQQVDFISQADRATLTVSHRIKGGNTELHLVSQDSVGNPTTSGLYNEGGVFGVMYKKNSAGQPTKLLTITPPTKAATEAKVHGKLSVTDTSSFAKDAHFAGNVNVEGVVTMQGKSLRMMTEELEATKQENMALRRRMEDLEDDTKDMQNRMTEMEQTRATMEERMQRLMSTLELMQQTTT